MDTGRARQLVLHIQHLERVQNVFGQLRLNGLNPNETTPMSADRVVEILEEVEALRRDGGLEVHTHSRTLFGITLVRHNIVGAGYVVWIVRRNGDAIFGFIEQIYIHTRPGRALDSENEL